MNNVLLFFVGYEEVHVPALKPKPFDQNEVSIQLFLLSSTRKSLLAQSVLFFHTPVSLLMR